LGFSDESRCSHIGKATPSTPKRNSGASRVMSVAISASP
jgi:hypothetical protein